MAGLLKALKALSDQTFPQRNYEVVVVDNGSEKALDSVIKPFEFSRLLKEELPGSYRARNTGVLAAKGDILGFTDSDCTPARDWIEKGVNALMKDPQAGLIGGKIKLVFKNPEAKNLAEIYERVTAFHQNKYIEDARFAATANAFSYKEVFNTVGLFDGNLKSGGDYEWGNRVFLAGYKQHYAENAIVTHPARSSLKDLIKKSRRLAGGGAQIRRDKRFPHFRFKEDIFELFFPLAVWRQYRAHPELDSMGRKIKFYATGYLVNWTKFLELIWIKLGAETPRR